MGWFTLSTRTIRQHFWNEIDKLIPDYEDRKQWLKVNGAGFGDTSGSVPSYVNFARGKEELGTLKDKCPF